MRVLAHAAALIARVSTQRVAACQSYSHTYGLLSFHRCASSAASSSLGMSPPSSADIVIRRVDNVVKPQVDKREYRGLELRNGMRILLVSDAEADKSAAALDVGVGHLSDPWELPGLAHFCEHMLFLGTEKYPGENEYSKFLSENAGSSNAFTVSDNTNYHFDVKPEALEGALDRFVQFFLSSQFTATATEREVCAVDSEHSNNLKSDPWRMLQIERHLSKPGHDYGKFGTGNKQTLLVDARTKSIEPREALLDFHQKHYSSNVMRVAVVGKESLDELEAMVCRLGFGEVVNKNVTLKKWDQPYGAEECARVVEAVPINDSRALALTFPFPDLTPEYRDAPSGYLSHILGHEGKGSLLSELKRRGWVTSLSAGYAPIAHGFGNFCINAELTIDGLSNVESIIAEIFHVVAMMRECGPQEHIFEENKKLRNIDFMFLDKTGPLKAVTNASRDLAHFPFEDILHAHYKSDTFRPERINELLSLIRPSNMYYRVVSKTFADLPDLTTEPVYGTQMRVRRIDQSTMARFESALATRRDCYQLPEPNVYIPEKFDLKPREENARSPHPQLIRNDTWARVWCKQDDEFKLPKAIMMAAITCPLASTDPMTTAAIALAGRCFEDAMSEEVYDASLAGLEHNIDLTIHGINAKVRGYDEKLPKYMEFILRRLVNFKPDPARFAIQKEALARTLRNFTHSQPYVLSQHSSSLIINEKMWSNQQLLAVAENLTIDDVTEALKNMRRAFHVEMLVHGNTTSQEASSMAAELVSILRSRDDVPSRSLFANEAKLGRERDIGLGSSLIYRQAQGTHDQAAVEVILQTGARNIREDMLLDLLCQMINEPVFNVLRTNETLGYLVGSFARRGIGSQALEIVVQGPNTPDMVDERVEAFLDKFRETLLEMDAATFASHVEAVITAKLEKPKTLGGRFTRFWQQIDKRVYNFGVVEQQVEKLRTLTKEDVIQFYDLKIVKGGAERRKLSVYVHSASDAVEKIDESRRSKRSKENGPAGDNGHAEKEEEKEEVVYMDSLKDRLAFYGLPKPFIQLPPIGTPAITACTGEGETTECKAKY